MMSIDGGGFSGVEKNEDCQSWRLWPHGGTPLAPSSPFIPTRIIQSLLGTNECPT